MKNQLHQLHNRPPSKKVFAALAVTLGLMLGLYFSLAVQPAQASPLVQTDYPAQTETAAQTVTVETATVTATLGAGTPSPTTGVTATATATATATRAGTLPPPGVTGTPSQLVPVTGADFTQPGGLASVGVWAALWLLGLILVAFGLRSRLSKRS